MPYTKKTMDPHVVGKRLVPLAKHFVFMLAREGANGLVYELKLRLRVRERPATFLVNFESTLDTATLRNSLALTREGNDFDYELGGHDCLAGPWTDHHFPVSESLGRLFGNGLRPWQRRILRHVKNPEIGCMRLVYDPLGQTGKSTFIAYLAYHNLAVELPCSPRMEDIVPVVLGGKGHKVFLVDIPTNETPQRTHACCAALQRAMNSPGCGNVEILVLSANLPQLTGLDMGRVTVYLMEENYSLRAVHTREAMALQPSMHARGATLPIHGLVENASTQ